MMEDLAQETVAENRASPLGKREQNHDELLLSSKKKRKVRIIGFIVVCFTVFNP
jgi:hypothetical protein